MPCRRRGRQEAARRMTCSVSGSGAAAARVILPTLRKLSSAPNPVEDRPAGRRGAAGRRPSARGQQVMFPCAPSAGYTTTALPFCTLDHRHALRDVLTLLVEAGWGRRPS
jgi:hypothetical protein